MPAVIKVENLSKAYQLGEIGTGTISRDLERTWARIRGKEDPFLKIGEINDRSVKGESDIVWSLKDLNFEIEQGDAVGIIGRNGAGKSTLLKILSRVTAPTTGSVKIKGRIASLLEVGTGFHPELTGRENIYLNGAILGMRKAEIKRQFDEIVDFSGVERYIDTPVKRYSSGMYVRLAFGVAAHLQSEILIVDEVLAVGDAEFQKKCLGKMADITKGQGRTILFVSHNIGAVQSLCNQGILLNNGTIEQSGKIQKVCNAYHSAHNDEISEYTGQGIIRNAKINIQYHKESNIVNLEVIISIDSAEEIDNLILGLSLKDIFDVSIIAVNNRHYAEYSAKFLKITKGTFSVIMHDLPLLPGNYSIDLFVGNRNADIEILSNVLNIAIFYPQLKTTSYEIDQRLNKIIINQVHWKIM